MTMSLFAAREGTSVPQWPNVKKCCRHLVPSSDFFVQSYAVPIKRSVPETLAFAFGSRLPSKTQRSRTRIFCEEVTKWKTSREVAI